MQCFLRVGATIRENGKSRYTGLEGFRRAVWVTALPSHADPRHKSPSLHTSFSVRLADHFFRGLSLATAAPTATAAAAAFPPPRHLPISFWRLLPRIPIPDTARTNSLGFYLSVASKVPRVTLPLKNNTYLKRFCARLGK